MLCGRALDGSFERLIGAEGFAYDPDAGRGFLTLQRGRELDLFELKRAVRFAGFELLSTDLVLRGELARIGGTDDKPRLGLLLARTGQEVLLLDGPSRGSTIAYADVAGRLATGDRFVQLRGHARSPHHGRLAVMPTHLASLPPTSRR